MTVTYCYEHWSSIEHSDLSINYFDIKVYNQFRLILKFIHKLPKLKENVSYVVVKFFLERKIELYHCAAVYHPWGRSYEGQL